MKTKGVSLSERWKDKKSNTIEVINGKKAIDRAIRNCKTGKK